MRDLDKTQEEACYPPGADSGGVCSANSMGRKMPDIDKTIDEVKSCLLPFESWERLAGESSAAYAAFRTYRDYGPERNIRRAVEAELAGKDGEAVKGKVEKRYRMWRNWAAQFRWRERAADYDQYLDRLKQTELRKTIEEQGKVHRMVTGKMLQVVNKKLDVMDPADLTPGVVREWVETAVKAEREAGQFADAHCQGVSTSRNSVPKQLEIQFTPEFEGL
jgi:hypothetical protein